MARNDWHRVFHPLCGSNLATLIGLVTRHGAPAAHGTAPLSIALACALVRLPFTLAERAWMAYEARHAPPVSPPLFIVGHMRSGTTHLHNLLAASGQFTTIPPVLAGMPCEARSLGRLVRPLIDPYLPENRLIDDVAVAPDSPTEDEIALANLLPPSYYHAIYFPRRFGEHYLRGLLFDGCTVAEVERWGRGFRRYIEKMAGLDRSRPLLVKNPAYTARIGMIRQLWPDAKFIHIYRNPLMVLESTRRALGTVLRELALQTYDDVAIDDVVLEVYPRLMSGLLAQADRLPQDTVAHVRFEALEADPMGVLADVYRTLQLDGFTAAAPRITHYLDRISGYRKSRYDIAPDL